MTTVKKVLDEARKWMGTAQNSSNHKRIVDRYNATKPLPVGYVVKYTDDWCDAFITYLGIATGATGIIGRECGVQRHIEIFKRLGIWDENGAKKPQAGDIITFAWSKNGQPNNNWADHIGIVESVSGNTITTIEGNYNRKVQRRTIPVGWGYIRGYARPKYTKGTTTTPTKSIDTIAKEVIAGKWGSGATRISNLTKAGYNATTVQNKVNELLKAPAKTTKTTSQIADEVINGEWGSGQDRVNRLKRAGYNPTTIQNEVNRKLSGKKTPQQVAREIYLGQGNWGTGAARVKKLQQSGYNVKQVQDLVNRMYR